MEKRLNKLKLSWLTILFIWYLNRNIYLGRIKKETGWIIKRLKWI